MWKEASECFSKAIAMEPENIEALAENGNVLRLLGKHEESLEMIDKALSLNP